MSIHHFVFLCTFYSIVGSEERVRKGAEKLTKHIGAKQQGRLDGFFKAVPKASPDKGKKVEPATKGKGTKRKVRV